MTRYIRVDPPVWRGLGESMRDGMADSAELDSGREAIAAQERSQEYPREKVEQAAFDLGDTPKVRGR